MFKNRLFRIPAILVTIAILAAIVFVHEKALAENEASMDELRQALVGAWVLVGSPDSEYESQTESYLKFWGERHWCISALEPSTGRIIYHHGGTYTLDGDHYEETFTFSNEENQHLVGVVLKFKITIDGDTYIQEGIGNKYTQKWKRLTAQ